MQTNTSSSNNKRIAKNTVLLYVRMLFLMIISLYTSRIVLDALGVDDFGIYNVVGGIVVVSSFFRSTMASATQRFLSYSIGKGNSREIEDVFKTAMFLHFLICIITFVLAESLGLWLINYKLSIPDERLSAALVVFQFSIITFIFDTLSSPYNAVIISKEKMGVFAYFSLLEAGVKLSIAFVLSIHIADNLVLYGFLLMANSILMRILYSSYCKRHFVEAKFCLKYNKQILKKMTGYMGWSLYANMAGAFYGQGVNILLNMFFGPAVNAARGLAYQIENAVLQFTTNFQMAVNPQIIKYYASEKLDEMYVLMKRSSRFSFFLLLVICMPLFLTADIVLNLWLKNVPDNTVIFCRLVLVISLINTVSDPLTTATKATGNLKLNALIGGTNLLMILPISYAFLKMGFGPVVVFYVNIVIALIGMMIRLFINKRLINFPVLDFIKTVFLRGWAIVFLAGMLPYFLNTIMSRNILTILVITVVSILLNVFFIFFIGLNNGERVVLTAHLKKIISNFIPR